MLMLLTYFIINLQLKFVAINKHHCIFITFISNILDLFKLINSSIIDHDFY